MAPRGVQITFYCADVGESATLFEALGMRQAFVSPAVGRPAIEVEAAGVRIGFDSTDVANGIADLGVVVPTERSAEATVRLVHPPGSHQIRLLQRLQQHTWKKRFMKLLLTSSGISNPSISDALVELLGKPIAESSALFIPTAIYPFPGGAGMAWQAICGRAHSPLCELGWKSLGLLELTALPTIREESWVPMVREADALLVWGGDVLYLCHWMRQSGLADLLPSLSGSVYVGVSAGSIVVTPYNCDAEFDLEFVPPGSDMARGADRALGLVDFTLYPHLDREDMPDTSLANIGKWASGIPVPTYAIDDETAIKVVDRTVEVVSEGHWKLFNP